MGIALVPNRRTKFTSGSREEFVVSVLDANPFDGEDEAMEIVGDTSYGCPPSIDKMGGM